MEYKDSIGRPLEVGQVVVWFHSDHSGPMTRSTAVVRELKPNGNIRVSRATTRVVYENGHWTEFPDFVPATVKVPEYLTIVDLTEEQVREKYGIVGGNRNAEQDRSNPSGL